MLRLSLCLIVLGASCKKETAPQGMPPAADWKGGASGSAPEAAPQVPPPTNPHGDMAGGGNPHGNMPGGAHGGMAGGGDPATPAKTAARTLEKGADGRSLLGPFTLQVPKEWTEKPVTSSMRAAQFELASDGSELVIYYFGEGGAGGVEANLERWLGQITQPDGKSTKDVAKIEKTKVAGQEATLVSVTGRYTTSMMPGGPPPVDKTDQMLLGAIVGSPSGPYYFKLVGTKATVEAHAPKFKAMLSSMKLK